MGKPCNLRAQGAWCWNTLGATLALAGAVALWLWLSSPVVLAATSQMAGAVQTTGACAPSSTPDAGDVGMRQPAACTYAMDQADNAGFTGVCQGASQTACAYLTSFFSNWSSHIALALILAGSLWSLTGLFQSSGSGLERGLTGHWLVFLHRLKATLLIGFLAWRLGSLLQGVESLWQNHTSDAFAADGLLAQPPLGFLQDGYIVLFLALVQLLLYWAALQMVFSSLLGVVAFSGLSRHTLGEVMRRQVGWLLVLALALALPTLVSWLTAIDFG